MERITYEMKITHVLHTTMIELDHHLFKCIQMKEITQASRNNGISKEEYFGDSSIDGSKREIESNSFDTFKSISSI